MRTAVVIISVILLLTLPSAPNSALNHIPNINNGGCGWVAYYLSQKWLDASIEVSGNYHHVFVRHNGRLVDSRGTYGPLFLYHGRTVTREELRKRLYHHDLWNNAFNLNDTLTIKNILGL